MKYNISGINIADNRPVAIKFAASWNLIESEREFYMYVNLHAYQNPKMERFGIPVVYYRGQWENFTLTALTKLDKDLNDLAEEEHHLKNPLDVLILIRNFVSFYKIIKLLTITKNKLPIFF